MFWTLGYFGRDDNPSNLAGSATPHFRFARTRYVRQGRPGLWHRVRSAHVLWYSPSRSHPELFVDLCCGPSRSLGSLEVARHLAPGPRCHCTWTPHPDPRGPARPGGRIVWPR